MKALSDRNLIDFFSLPTKNKTENTSKQIKHKEKTKQSYNSGVYGKSFHLAQIVNLSKFSILLIFLNSWM